MAQEQNVSSYERKIQIIMDCNLSRFKTGYTAEQYELELRVAKNILSALGVIR